MAKISIRTMMLVTFGVGLLAVLFTRGAPSVDAFHTILVLAFAIPGASWGYDRKPTSGLRVLKLHSLKFAISVGLENLKHRGKV